MTDALSSASSGLRYQAERTTAAAHNGAALSAPQSVELRAEARQAPEGGVETVIATRPVTRPELGAPSDGTTGSAPQVTLVDVVVDQVGAPIQARALVQVVRTQDEMLGSAVDLTA
ncbi:MAG: hypothetical protein ABIL09_23795 [Gemmatimonadota bacterium]